VIDARAYEATRLGTVEFSQTYMLVQQSFLVLGDSPIHAAADVDRVGRKIAGTYNDSITLCLSGHGIAIASEIWCARSRALKAIVRSSLPRAYTAKLAVLPRHVLAKENPHPESRHKLQAGKDRIRHLANGRRKRRVKIFCVARRTRSHRSGHSQHVYPKG
jgi:hypothetical protein